MFPFQFSDCNALNSKGRILYIHNGLATSTDAFELSETAKIRILLPRSLGVVSVLSEVFNESLDTVLIRDYASFVDLQDGFDVFEFNPDFSESGVGLFFFRIKVRTACGDFYGYKTEDNIYLSYNDEGPLFQLTICDFKHSAPVEVYGGVIYHIFIDRFNRGGRSGLKDGAVLVEDWRGGIPEYPAYPGAPLKNNTFYGGTLDGIREKLDYIRSLGVNVIYLSPVFSAASNHKYDTSDYMSVDEMFGGDQALKDLIDAAKEKGIGIVLDGVFNHTGSDSIYFNKNGTYPTVGAYQSKNSPYYKWYEFKQFPNKYTCWWDIDILPRINPSIPECSEYFVGKNGVIDKYAKFGIAGFRLDVVDELPDTFVESIKDKLCQTNPTSVLYGEVWEDASNKIAYSTRKKYYLGSELDGVMNYPLRKGIIDFILKRGTDSLKYALTDIINNAPERISHLQMNLLGTHDTERILTVLGGESADGRSNEYLSKKKMGDIERGIAKRRLKMAYTILATVPGIPTIFYGDEAGLEGYHDPFNRLPYPWGKEDYRLINHYKKLGEFRKENDVYKRGRFSLSYIDQDLLIFKRFDKTNSYVTVVNNTGIDLRVGFDSDAVSGIGASLCRSDNEFIIPPYTADVIITDLDAYIDIN